MHLLVCALLGTILLFVPTSAEAWWCPSHGSGGHYCTGKYVGPYPPPKRYDFAFPGKVYVLELGFVRMIRECGWTVGCAPVGGDLPGTYAGIKGKTCTVKLAKVGVVMPGFGRVDSRSQKNILRHEIGHCNGWPANHPK